MQKLTTKIFWVTTLLFLLFVTAFAQEKRKIAILPFTNNGAADMNWLSRGIEEILYDKLSNLDQVQVYEKETFDLLLRKANIRKFSDLTVKNAFFLGKQSGVDVILAGYYQVIGNELNISFRVVSTYTGGDIFSRRYTGALSEIYQLNADAITELMNDMAVPLSANEKQMLSKKSTNSIQAFEYYCKAYLEFLSGANMEAVASLFTRALAEDPSFWEAQYNLGVIFYNFDNYQKALLQFDQVLKNNPNFYKPYYGSGVIYFLQRKYDLAIQNFKKSLAINPHHDRSLYYLGRVYLKKDSLAKGIDLLNRSAKLNPNYAPTHFQLARANMKRGWYKTAIQAFKKSLKLNSNNYRAYNGLGECYYRIQRFDDAIFNYKKVNELKPAYSTAYFNIGNTIYKKGALQEIVSAYLEILETRYTKISPNDPNKQLVNELQQLKGQSSEQSRQVYQDMVVNYRTALSYEPAFYEAAYNLALTYENLGRVDSAMVFYKQAIAANPNLVRAHMRLGRLYEKRMNYTEALHHFKAVVAIEPSYFAATPKLGEEYRYINIVESVLKEYQLRLDLQPNDPKTMLVVARIYDSLGRYGQAEKYYLQTVQVDPSNREATDALRELKRQKREL